MENLNLTEKEIQFLTAFGQSDFYEEGLDSVVWDYSVNDELPYSGKTVSGVVSSLSQKGILQVCTKQETGDMYGVYYLTEKAKEDKYIAELVDGQKN